MIMWLLRLLIGCRHKWDVIRQGRLTNDDDIPVGYYYHLRCHKCGRIKDEKLL